ncbi:MAG: 2-amino-4-hydroxy-6-hydroxymethyldihydropteridine diphosphokinase [Salinibacter sp.]
MRTAYLGLGSNEGARQTHLQAAVDGLRRVPDVRVRAASPVYETEAHTTIPEETQPAFLNAVLEVAVECRAERLLARAHALERAEGRVRPDTERWAPRPLDVDLLSVGQRTCRTDRLTLPHPRLADRRFVLRPWADLAPDVVVPPPFDASVQVLLEACTDDTAIRRTDRRLHLSDGVTGPDVAE